ncbi:exonuclease domain-containing protein [Pandoraea sp. NPDC087047]|uniref:exonuclease domain-containing protein n=1 Tax=Pandoraea sp. NPDC087047 TaxID=3364390 RepID=UPI0037F401BC
MQSTDRPTTSRILVVDLEATCTDESSSHEYANEIIEIGACWWSDSEAAPSLRFQTFVKPTRNPLLTSFCKELTGIRQEDVDTAPSFSGAASLLRKFVTAYQQPHSFWTSWGAWDQRQLALDCGFYGLADPIALPHVNGKRWFSKARGGIKDVGLRKACELAGMEFEGAHHRALDDALNVAKLLSLLISSASPPLLCSHLDNRGFGQPGPA